MYWGNKVFGTLNCVHCREVYYIVSLSRRVPYWRFHCIATCSLEEQSIAGPQFNLQHLNPMCNNYCTEHA